MTDFLDAELTTDQCDNVVRRHAFGFVHEQDAIKSCG
jgi:hypothetical protein